VDEDQARRIDGHKTLLEVLPQVEKLLLVIVIFFGAFTQSLAGFGSALVAMALLPLIMDIRVATPLVSLVALTIEAILVIRYHRSLNVRAVWPLVLAAMFGIPIGVYALKGVDEEILLRILGLVITGYALYAFFELKLPELRHRLWGVLAGFTAGLLGGAYNTSGPPVVVYGDCRRWAPLEFKGNLQGFFVVNSIVVVATHALSGNYTPLVLMDYLWALPATLLGILAGTSLDRYINPTLFRKVVLGLLIVMGLRLVF
jgi:uncharacterized membrane protein YfcA